MGLLDSVIGALGSAPAGGGGQPDLVSAVIGMLGQGQGAGGLGGLAGLVSKFQQGGLGDVVGSWVGTGQGAGGLGGLAGLVGKFQQGGLGDVVGSWVGTGQNLPISADQLGKVLGNDTVSGLARQLGMGQGDVLGQLSQMLPQVVDKLTPNGQVPQGDIGGMGDLAGMLGGLLKR